MTEATLSTRGRLTIPKMIREQCGLSNGGKVDVFLEDGRIVVERHDSLAVLKDLAQQRQITIEQMRGSNRIRARLRDYPSSDD